jgi:hypothetical protein
METTVMLHSPRRITDLIEQYQEDRVITCFPAFEILPVDFLHEKNPFKAYIFLCRFNGEIDGEPYSFRKCYARGCPNNKCSHVSLAVMIANRYLQRDYRRLAEAGIQVDEKLFSLEEMLLKYDGYQKAEDTVLTLEEYIQLSQKGSEVSMNILLEYVPAVEHFANHKNSQTFLTADFIITTQGTKQHFQRCLSCFQTDQEAEEKAKQVAVANARLQLVYQMLNNASVQYDENFFE